MIRTSALELGAHGSFDFDLPREPEYTSRFLNSCDGVGLALCVFMLWEQCLGPSRCALYLNEKVLQT
jgi:hypothetical protein